LAWTVCGLLICLVVVTYGAGLLRKAGSTNVVQLVGETLVDLVAPVVFATVAALILSRQPRNTIGWVLMVPVGLYAVGAPLENHVEYVAPTSPAPTGQLLLVVWFNNWAWLLLIFPLLHVPLLFPSGRPPTPRWRWVSVAAISWATLFVLLVTLSRQVSSGTTPDLVLDNPIGVLAEATVERLVGVWIAGLLALVVACVAALFVRYRRANYTERQQIRWLLYACAVFLVVYVGGSVGGLGGSTSIGGYVWTVLFGLSVVTLPAAIGVAILRYRLYEIDVIINRTLVYVSLTAMLAAVYLGGVISLQYAFRTLTGQGSQLAIVASTLAIAALFNPLRRRVQAFVDRRFYRRKYDARNTLEHFSSRLRDETDLGRLGDELVGVVRETMQPAHASLWLRTVSEPGESADDERAS
jgi:hypothetical protein